MKHLVVLSGAGISAESGLKTFRDSGGLWENYDVMEVASIEGWRKNPELVLEFYNMRRKQAWTVEPNKAHHFFAQLEDKLKVTIITQNVDRLHEKAGSINVLHLHGDLHQIRCSIHESEIYEWEDKPLGLGEVSKNGHQLRPNIVWFGEQVPMMDAAMEVVESADIFVVVGTSLMVYPAAGLLQFAPRNIPIFVIDPDTSPSSQWAVSGARYHFINKTATAGVADLDHFLTPFL